ncbi:MAG: SAM-dependent chlorinase/fluorinase [Gemmatimonadota bacterium]|nr:SAM-dependent chlorinase/fluorinase [Gemmatimonadota bacterium]
MTLLSDFGTADSYVAEMKAAVLAAAPDAALVDVSHAVAPGDVEGGAWLLARVWEAFPPGTVHLAVVDPGVGGGRRAVAVRIAGRWFVGPDNGLLTRVLADGPAEAALLLDPAAADPRPVSPTFHGRDLFAPAAGRLAAGVEAPPGAGSIDPETLRRLSLPPVERLGRGVRGRVAHVDRFGNLVTDIPGTACGPSALVEVAGTVIPGLRASYAHGEPNRPIALVGSAGTLEIAVRDGSAAEMLGADRGAEVRVRVERD